MNRPRKPITYQRLRELSQDVRIARKSLEYVLPHVLPFHEDFETYRWKVFFNTPRNKTKVFAEV
jgi:hypothetical protein